MAYQALYRVWRSQRFEDIVGQQAVTQTLKNAIMQKKTSHAYLFTGPRGTGKTSAAKIFAKAINCPNSHDGEPCNECEICQAITEGRLNDVIEIDAASNNGVEEIRDIRDKVKYAPTQAEYKVYIIDEVHMLSTGAFNALLKTLEEPPEKVIFILATTEPHKVPLTIISRTQRFDFKRIATQDIVEHMAHILAEIDVPYEEQALYVIARAAEGGMRDALSILDQAISFSQGSLTTDDAMQVTGSLTYEMMDQYLAACTAKDVEGALEILEKILGEGKEARRFLEDLLLYCRDLLMYQQAPKLLQEKSGSLSEAFKELAKTPAETIYTMIKLLNETQNEIRFTNHANVYLEVVTVKLATLKGPVAISEPTQPTTNESASATELAALQQQLNTLQQELKQLRQEPVATNKPAPAPVNRNNRSYKVPTERVYQVLEAATKGHLNRIRNVWGDLLMMLSVSQRAMLKASEPVAASGEGLVLAFDYEILCQRAMDDTELQLAVHNNLSKLVDFAPNYVGITHEVWPKLRQDFLAQNRNSPAENLATIDEGPIELVPEEKPDDLSEPMRALFGEAVEIIDD